MPAKEELESIGFDKQAWLEQQPPHSRVALEALDSNQARVDELLAAYAQERRALEMKYEKVLGAGVCVALSCHRWSLFGTCLSKP